MTSQEIRNEFAKLYTQMAQSGNLSNMKVFGNVMTEMFMWMADNKPDAAISWLEKLSGIKWRNFLTQKEAETIIANMTPRGPWTREQWKQAMDQHGFVLEEEPCYNRCAMYVTMSMIYSDSINTINKYAAGADAFEVVHALAIDKLKDKDEVFNVRNYFGL